MNTTTKGKRWNGKIETLKPDYLKEVLSRMESYGDRVQFRLNGAGDRPAYQVVNTAGKKMAFDGNHHLTKPEADEFIPGNATGICTMEQVKRAQSGIGISRSGGVTAAPRARSSAGSGSGGDNVGSGAARRTTAAVRGRDMINAERYEYFKANRDTLPRHITEKSDEIGALMEKGMSAEEAFAEVIKLYF